jgi:hypothetical protein
MEVDDFARNWGREFPESEMTRLTEDIRRINANRAPGAELPPLKGRLRRRESVM